MNNLITLAVAVMSISTINPVQAPINIETKIAVAATATTEGNYFKFVDDSGGWWLEAEEDSPNFGVGQIFECTINNFGTEGIEDDTLLKLETLEFVE